MRGANFSTYERETVFFITRCACLDSREALIRKTHFLVFYQWGFAQN